MGRPLYRLVIVLIVGGTLLLFVAPLSGQSSGVSGTNLEFYHPSLDPSGYFGVNGPRLLRPGQPSFKISQSFAGDHLFQVGVGTTPVDIVDTLFTTHLTSAIGINEFMTLGLEIPYHPYAREANFNTLAPYTTHGLGDIRLAMKFRILEEQNATPGLALLFTNSFPTGDETKFLGTSHMVPGIDAVIGKEFELFSLAANLGGRFPEQKNVLGVNFDDQITYGGGIKVPFGFWDRQLSFLGEIRGHLQPDQVQIITAPVEFTTGLQKEFGNGVTVQAGAGGAWNNAIGNPRLRGLVTLAYSPFSPDPAKKSKKVLEKQGRMTLYFKFASVEPTTESRQWILEAAALLKNQSRIKTIQVEGHTDDRGSRRQNDWVALKRAEAVKRILVTGGVDARLIEVKGMNADFPVAPNRSSQGRALNRRVEMRVD